MKMLVFYLALFGSALPAWAGSFRTISDRTHHLGPAERREWQIFEGKTPEAESLRLTFESEGNGREYTLFIRQDDVKQEWTVSLNGKKLGQLFLMEADLVQTLPIPAGGLRPGENELEIKGRVPDDILIHRIEIGDDTKEKLLSAGPITVTIEEGNPKSAIPARLTLVDQNGSLTPIFDFGDTNVASRPGVVYTGTGQARLKLLPGRYSLYATRGPEYGVATMTEFDPSVTNSAKLTLERKADTRGWVSSDTHIHSLSLSKHGDALLRERIITLAGEAIELPVSTEHNQHADYGPVARELGLDRYFTILPGNEVTTKKGHFNIFPVRKDAKPPDATLESWPALFRQMWSTPDVKVVVLNHPKDTHSGFTPFALTNLNLRTGRNLQGDFEFEFNAMELVNSGAMRSQWMEPFGAWRALLNRGYRVTGVGSSDSHDVSRFIVGQGRTYIRVDDSDVSRIDIEKACASLKDGHAVVSLGLIAQMTVSDPEGTRLAGPGDLHLAKGDELECKITVQAPLAPGQSPQLTLVANGAPIAEFFAAPEEANGFRTTVTRRIPRPPHDTYYVLIAEIHSDPAPYWGLARPYQPTSRRFRPTLIGATNPVWVDTDGNGKYTSPRAYAESLVAKHAGDRGALFRELATFDYSVAVQCADILKISENDLSEEALKGAHLATRRAFKWYVESEGGPKADE